MVACQILESDFKIPRRIVRHKNLVVAFKITLHKLHDSKQQLRSQKVNSITILTMSYNFPLLGAGRPGDPAGPVVPHLRLADHLLLLRVLHRGADQLHGQQAGSSKVEKQCFASFDLLTSRLGARAYYSLASILRETDGSQQLVTLPQVGWTWTKTWELKFELKSQGVEVAEGAAAVAAAGQAGDGGV